MLRHNWTLNQVETLYKMPFMDLLFKAQQIHRQHFNANEIQPCSLVNIREGACPEDCKFCSQSRHYHTDINKHKLYDLDTTLAMAKKAKAQGASRICLAAAWRNPSDENLQKVITMVKAIKALGLETCITIGFLTQEQAFALKNAGLDYYNHNLETSEEYYAEVVQSHTYQDRLQTVSHVATAGLKVCSGGIFGMGETHRDRLMLLIQLANLAKHPQSVPINKLAPISGTPMEKNANLDEFDFVRLIALARIMMPASYVRLTAGRERMSQSSQTLCFMAGANSLFLGPKLLTVSNTNIQDDWAMFNKLNINLEQSKKATLC